MIKKNTRDIHIAVWMKKLHKLVLLMSNFEEVSGDVLKMFEETYM